ncbi:formyltetrahydrofolate hydrolase, partial [Bradyrhizobium sp. USDA 4449]
MTTSYVFTASCADRPGIVSGISAAIFESGYNILDAQQFDDQEASRFFVRIEFDAIRDNCSLSEVREQFGRIAAKFEMTWNLRSIADRRRVMLMASRFDHCLEDLLYRWRTGELEMDIAAVVSNHPRDVYPHL